MAQHSTTEYIDSSELRCFLLGVGDDMLLLPNTMVAEVADAREAEAQEDAPDWFRGVISWRGIRIPLIDYAPLVGSNVMESAPRIAVVNTLNRNEALRFVAVKIAAIPRLIHVRDEDIGEEALDADGAQRYLHKKVNVGGQEAYIPDIDALEKALVDMKVGVS